MKRILIVFVYFCLPVFAFAHSGGTDSKGGHSSPTGYHYHHGQRAHDHDHGICTLDEDFEEQLQHKIRSSLYMSGVGAVGLLVSILSIYLYSKQAERLVEEAKRRGEFLRPNEPSWPTALSIISFLIFGAGLYGYFVG